MADTPALRAKRARKHKAGDHRLCRSATCDAAGTDEHDEDVAVTSRSGPTVTEPGSRGARLWAEMHEGRGLAPTQVVLLEEACRMANRLDRLDEMLENPARAWLRFDVGDLGGNAVEITVTVDRLLSEARMQETAFKGIVTELRQAQESDGAVPSTTPAPVTGGGNVVGLRARVLAKQANAAG